MDSKDNLILQLAQMLHNNGSNSSGRKLPSKDCVNNASDGDQVLDVSQLKIFLNNRLELSDIDTCRANKYLLIPVDNERWRVFVVDCDNNPFTQLDDYNGKLLLTTQTPAPIENYLVSR